MPNHQQNTPRADLVALLVDLFSSAELMEVLRDVFVDDPKMLNSLPLGTGAAELAACAVDAVERRGLEDDLFAFIEIARPRRKRIVQDVQLRWALERGRDRRLAKDLRTVSANPKAGFEAADLELDRVTRTWLRFPHARDRALCRLRELVKKWPAYGRLHQQLARNLYAVRDEAGAEAAALAGLGQVSEEWEFKLLVLLGIIQLDRFRRSPDNASHAIAAEERLAQALEIRHHDLPAAWALLELELARVQFFGCSDHRARSAMLALRDAAAEGDRENARYVSPVREQLLARVDETFPEPSEWWRTSVTDFLEVAEWLELRHEGPSTLATVVRFVPGWLRVTLVLVVLAGAISSLLSGRCAAGETAAVPHDRHSNSAQFAAVPHDRASDAVPHDVRRRASPT